LGENRPKYSQTHLLSNLSLNFFRGKSTQQFGTLMSFSKGTQSEKSPNMRKLAQSGHPDEGTEVKRRSTQRLFHR
jgi:hypothetical protein